MDAGYAYQQREYEGISLEDVFLAFLYPKLTTGILIRNL